MGNTAKRRGSNPARNTETQPKRLKASVTDMFPGFKLEGFRQRIQENEEKAAQQMSKRVYLAPEDQNNIDKSPRDSLDEKQELPITQEDGLPRLEQLEQKLSELMAEAAKLPPHEKIVFLEEFREAADTWLQELAKLEKKPDISHIPLWGGKIKDGPAIEWLDKYYGDYLTTFRAKENRLYRQDVETHNPKLVARLNHEALELGKKPREFLPVKTHEVDDRAKNMGFDKKGRPIRGQAKEVLSTAGVLRSRKHRQKHAKGSTFTPT